MEDRKAQFKKGLVKGEGSKKRIEAASKLQKEKREKSVSSKRSRHADAEEAGITQFSNADIVLALQQLQSRDPEGLRMVRKILSVDDPPLDTILLSPTLPIPSLIHFLKVGNEVQQLDAAWCLTNLATGTHEQTGHVVAAAPYLIQLLEGLNLPLVEQAVWALGNLSADCVQFRDVLRANGILPPLVAILQISLYSSSNTKRQRQTHSLARTAAFALANQARGQNPKLEQILDLNIAPIIAQILRQETDTMSDAGDESSIITEVQIEIAWVLTYLTAQVADHTLLVDTGLLPLLVHHLNSPVTALVIPILRSVGNIISRSDHMTDLLLHPSINPPLIPILKTLLSNEHRAILKEAAYVLSNIAGGPQIHVDQLVTTPGLLQAFAAILRQGQFDIAREAAYSVCNIASNPKHIENLVANGIVVGMLHLLSSSDSEVAHLGLTFVEMVLKFHPQGPSIVQREDGIEKLEALQFHNNHELYLLANQLIDSYFGEDVDVEGEGEGGGGGEQQVEYPAWRVRQL